MNALEFTSGLDQFSLRYDAIQKRLAELETNGPMSGKIHQEYRNLLDEIVQIGLERSQYCSSFIVHA